MANETPEKFTKPGFDGRLAYFKLVEDYLTDIRLAAYSNKTRDWFETLLNFTTFVTPFIKPGDSDKLEKQITKIDNMFINAANFGSKTNQVVVNYNISKEIRQLNNDLFKFAKHILLPIKDESDDNFNMEKWMKESDL